MNDVDELREITKEAIKEAHFSMQAKGFAQTQAMILMLQALSQIAKQDLGAAVARELEVLRESTALNSEDGNVLQEKIAEELGELAAYIRGA